MKIKKILASTTLVAMVMTVGTTSVFAASAYTNNYDALLGVTGYTQEDVQTKLQKGETYYQIAKTADKADEYLNEVSEIAIDNQKSAKVGSNGNHNSGINHNNNANHNNGTNHNGDGQTGNHASETHGTNHNNRH